MKKRVGIFFISITLIVICFLGGHYISSANVLDNEKLINFIVEVESVEKVSILMKQYKKNLLAVLYNDGQKDKLIILQQDGIFKNRYKYFGGGSHSSQFATYNYSDPEYGTLIIVYGNNSDLKAYSYEFINDRKQYKRHNLGQYIVDIYLLKDSKDISCEGYVYDVNNNLISDFNSIK